jgi:hypothetical protein
VLLGERFIFRGCFKLKGRATMGADRGLGGDLSVALGAEEAIGRAALGTGRYRRIERRAAVDTERLTTAGASLEADGELSGARWAFHRLGL